MDTDPTKKFLDDYREFYGSDRCIICGSSPLENNVKFFSHVWTDDLSRKMSIFTCLSCGAGYSYPFLTKDEEGALYRNYPQHYILENITEGTVDIFQKTICLFERPFERIFFSKDKVLLKKFLSGFLFQRLFQTYPIYVGPHDKNISILDVGCGDGYFLNKARGFGWDCYGTEYNDSLIRRLDSKGISACKDIKEYIGKRQFDVIRINHVLEHLKDPSGLLDDVYGLLKENGSLIIGLPNFDSWAKVFGEYYALHLPYHRYHYTRQGLMALIKRHGFVAVYYKTKSTGELAASYFRKHKTKRFKPVLRIADILASVFFDLFNKGDCIELYATKSASGRI